MFKRFCYIFFILFTLKNLSASEESNIILELQQNEIILLDNIYDHRDFVTELWNIIVVNPRPDNEVLATIDKGLITLDYTLKLCDLLLEVQDQLIKHYTINDKNIYNLNLVKNNKNGTLIIMNEILSLKDEFLIKNVEVKKFIIEFKVIPKTNDMFSNDWTSIPNITDKQFRQKIFNYYSSGVNKFIHEKPVVLIFYNIDQEPSINQLLNIEDIYEKYKDKVDFYIINSKENKELIKVFKIISLPTIYYLNMDDKLKKHVGTKEFSDIEEMLLTHLDLNRTKF